jgi:hypothetical protein
MLSKRITAAILIIFVLLASSLSFFPNRRKVSASSNLVEINFQPNNSDIANPERGSLNQRGIWPDQSGSISFSRGPYESLVWVYFRIDNYRNKAFDTAALNRINATFNAVRDANLKIIFTFTYNWDGPDAPLNIVLGHISQITPILQQHSDVISTIHAGFVGKWGEWHGSSNNLTAPENQIQIINALLNALPQDRTIQLRYPRDKEVHFGGPMTGAQAFSGTDQARVGHHNLCVLADGTDGGTYRSNNSTYCNSFPGSAVECWKDFISQEGQFTPVGGETCDLSSNNNLQYVTCPNALYNFELMRYSYLNSDFYTPALNKLESGGCLAEIRRRLGYRLVLEKLNVSSQVNPGGLMNFQLQLRNEGYASAYNPRPIYLVLDEKSGSRKEIIQLTSQNNPKTTDPRWWQSGQTTTINEQVRLPSNLPSGTYNLYFWLPDPYQSLRDRPEYAIRFANNNVWQPTTGYNLLFSNLQIGGPPITYEPSPTPSGPPGDGNGDWVVDGQDFIIWLTHFGQNVSGVHNGDYDNNGQVRISDYIVWVNNY